MSTPTLARVDWIQVLRVARQLPDRLDEERHVRRAEACLTALEELLQKAFDDDPPLPEAMDSLLRASVWTSEWWRYPSSMWWHAKELVRALPRLHAGAGAVQIRADATRWCRCVRKDVTRLAERVRGDLPYEPRDPRWYPASGDVLRSKAGTVVVTVSTVTPAVVHAREAGPDRTIRSARYRTSQWRWKMMDAEILQRGAA